MKRKSGGCCSGCLILVLVLLLTDSWLRSSWPLRAVELLAGVVVVASIAVRQRHHALRTQGSAPAP